CRRVYFSAPPPAPNSPGPKPARRISRHDGAGFDIGDDRAPEANHRAIAHVHAIADAGSTSDVGVASDRRCARHSYVGPNQAPVSDCRIVVNDGVRQNTDMAADRHVARDHHAGHQQDIVAERCEPRNNRFRVNDSRISRFIYCKFAVSRGAGTKGSWTSRDGQNLGVCTSVQRIPRIDLVTKRSSELLAMIVIDEPDAAEFLPQTVQRLHSVPIERKNQEWPGRQPRGAHAVAKHNSSWTEMSFIAPATRPICASVNSGNIGNDNDSTAVRSECGNCPSVPPRSAKPGRRCTGVG